MSNIRRKKKLSTNPELVSLLQGGATIVFPSGFEVKYDFKTNSVHYKEGLIPGSIPHINTKKELKETLKFVFDRKSIHEKKLFNYENRR